MSIKKSLVCIVNTWPSILILNGFFWRALVLSYLEENSFVSTMHVRKGNEIRNRTRKLHLCATRMDPTFPGTESQSSRVDGPWPQKSLEYIYQPLYISALQIYTVETGTPIKKCKSYNYLPYTLQCRSVDVAVNHYKSVFTFFPLYLEQ